MGIAATALLPLLAGCYTYSRSTVDAAPIGAAVRLRLAPDEAERVGHILRRDDRSLEGELLSRSDSGDMMIKVPTSSRDVETFGETHQRISLSRAGVQEVEVRRLDRGHTMIVLLGTAAVAAYVGANAFAQATKSPDQAPRGGTDNSRSPVVRFYLPLLGRF